MTSDLVTSLSLSLNFVFILCVQVYCLHVCICVPGAREGEKRALDPLELELYTVVGHHVGTGK